MQSRKKSTRNDKYNYISKDYADEEDYQRKTNYQRYEHYKDSDDEIN